jgi:hypothetical protein
VTEPATPPDAVTNLVSLLFSRGYSEESEYEEATFGNVIRTFNGESTRVQIIRDRGKWSVAAAPVGVDRWFWATSWQDYFSGGFTQVRYLSVDEQCNFFFHQIELIEDAIAEDPDVLNKLSNAQWDSAHARGLV